MTIYSLLIHDENFNTEYPSIIHSQTEYNVINKHQLRDILEKEGGYVAQLFKDDKNILEITTTVRKDNLKRIPKIGDLVCYNPPYYKGLEYGKVIGFNNGGLPMVKVKEEDEEDEVEICTPKTGFIIIK